MRRPRCNRRLGHSSPWRAGLQVLHASITPQANGPLTPATSPPCPGVAPAATLPAFPLYCLRCRSLILFAPMAGSGRGCVDVCRPRRPRSLQTRHGEGCRARCAHGRRRKRYRDALVLVNNSDPKGTAEGDAALEDMEDIIDACIKQRGCLVSNQLATYKRLLKTRADAGRRPLKIRKTTTRCCKPTRTIWARRRTVFRGRACRHAAQRPAPRLRQDGAVQPGRAGRHPALAH